MRVSIKLIYDLDDAAQMFPIKNMVTHPSQIRRLPTMLAREATVKQPTKKAMFGAEINQVNSLVFRPYSLARSPKPGARPMMLKLTKLVNMRTECKAPNLFHIGQFCSGISRKYDHYDFRQGLTNGLLESPLFGCGARIMSVPFLY
jgi:hypothetical protein